MTPRPRPAAKGLPSLRIAALVIILSAACQPVRKPDASGQPSPRAAFPAASLTPLPLARQTIPPGPEGTDTWGGATSQDQPFQIVAADGGIQGLLIGFEGPGCTEWSPMTADYGEPVHRIEAAKWSSRKPAWSR